MIQVYLLSDASTESLAGQIVEFLAPFFEGTAELRRIEAVIPYREYWTWKDLFAVGRDCKGDAQVGNEERCYLFLVGGSNENNWFASFDSDDPSVAFVQCSGWEQFDLPDPTYAVAYHVLAMVTAMRYFSSKSPSERYHFPSIGCMFDFTIDKSEVLFKLKSADICQNCVQEIAITAGDKAGAMAYLMATKASMEAIKQELFPADWGEIFGVLAYDLCINEELDFRLCFGQVKLLLPISNGYEKVFYLMLLKYREGLSYQQLMEDAKLQEFIEIYFKFFASTGSLDELRKRLLDERSTGKLRSRLMTLKSRMAKKMTQVLKNYPEIRDQLSIRNRKKVFSISVKPTALQVGHADINKYLGLS
ncbi:hypothetical protein [Cyclobacterium xiamenense]|uniref:hypothetical protein n=1 Tax=Cyclobacterium xiamenense TaxID=1297121 RepID=UPI0012BA33B8|nr:hypothetical protein [Cyclobacterium xiamenense]